MSDFKSYKTKGNQLLSKWLIFAFKKFSKFVGDPGGKTTRSLFRVFQAAAYSIIAVLLLTLITSIGSGPWGTFGDFFGGVLNPILSFLMLMGVLMTIVLQQKELKEARAEFKRSADALSAQSDSLVLQNFENTLFQMIRLHNDIVDGIKVGDQKNTSGRESFMFFEKRLMRVSDHVNNNPEADRSANINQFYSMFFFENQHSVGHYFRNLYTIIKFIDTSDISDKKKYTSIVRAQLSSFELLVLFYNCLSDKGSEKFKGLVEKYELLENMDLSTIQNHKEDIPLYSKEAYGDLDVEEHFNAKPTE